MREGVRARASEGEDVRPLEFRKNAPGDYDVHDARGRFLFNVWRAPVTPSQWLVSVGRAAFPNPTRHEAVRFGLKTIGRRDLLGAVRDRGHRMTESHRRRGNARGH